jgi:hypothetical protein
VKLEINRKVNIKVKKIGKSRDPEKVPILIPSNIGIFNRKAKIMKITDFTGQKRPYFRSL